MAEAYRRLAVIITVLSDGRMSETFQIRTDALGSGNVTSITKDKFEDIVHAARMLREALAIEQKYEVLLQNYVDFEKEILGRLANELIYGSSEYLDFYNILLAFDVRLVNFLASAKLYADQAPRHVKRCLGDAGFGAAKSFFGAQHDANFSYRLMDALRNHAIHGDLPVHGAGIGGEWTDLHGEEYLEHTITLRIEKAKLADNAKFKASVLRDLPDSVDLATAVRSYMGSLNSAHLEIRTLLKEAVNSSRSIITAAIDSHLGGREDASGKAAVGIRAQRLEGNHVIESVPLLLAWDDVRLKLNERNRKLINLHRRHVTGRSGDKNALRDLPK